MIGITNTMTTKGAGLENLSTAHFTIGVSLRLDSPLAMIQSPHIFFVTFVTDQKLDVIRTECQHYNSCLMSPSYNMLSFSGISCVPSVHNTILDDQQLYFVKVPDTSSQHEGCIVITFSVISENIARESEQDVRGRAAEEELTVKEGSKICKIRLMISDL